MMTTRFFKTTLFFSMLVLVLFFTNACKKDITFNYQYVVPEAKKFIFMPGSQWVYKSDTGNIYDTVKCISLLKDTIIYDWVTYKEDKVRDLNEYYAMKLSHSKNNSIELHYFLSLFEFIDLSGTNSIDIHKGQTYMEHTIEQIDSIHFVGSGNYLYPDTMIYVSSLFFSCKHSRLKVDQLKFNYFNYDTDIFLSENIGLVKRYDQYEGWSLVSYNVFPVNY